MKSKYFFFIALIGIATISVQQANSQVGPATYRGDTYQDEEYGFGIHIWTGGLPEWLHDYTTWEGKKIYVPYKVHETDDYITYESASITFTLSKTFCDIKLYDKGKVAQGEEPLISSLSHVVKQAKNGTDVWADSTINSLDCDVEIKTDPDGINAIVAKSNTNGTFKTIYDTSLTKRDLEWTWEYENLNEADTKFGFTSTCEGKLCDMIKIGSKTIEPGAEISKEELGDSKLKFNGNNSLEFDPDPNKKNKHDYLHMIKINENSAIMDFTDAKNALPLGETLIIDPTFTSSTPTDGYVRDNVDNAVCDTGGTKDTTATAADIGTYNSAAAFDCARAFFDYDTSSIPDDVDVTDTDFSFDINTISGTGRNCSYIGMGTVRASASASDIFNILTTGTVFASNNAECATASNNKLVDLGTDGDAAVEATLASGFFTFGMKNTDETVDATAHLSELQLEEGSGTPDPTITITYTENIPNPPNLSASPIISTIHLSWTPNGTTTSYRIDKGVTAGDECTTGTMNVLVADTGSNSTTYTDEAVSVNNCYSYQVYGFNPTQPSAASNFANATLFDVTSTNTNMVDIGFERITVNSSALRLNVTYTIPANLTCSFYYSLEGTNRSYYNFPSIIIDSTHNESSFLFLDANDDIITAQCDDVDSNATASYVITQTNFPLQEQIADFRNGDFGTRGKIGALDLVTLIAIILAMVGLNRVNESVGGVFMLIIVGVLSYFGFLHWVTFLTSAIAVGLLWTIASTRKN